MDDLLPKKLQGNVVLKLRAYLTNFKPYHQPFKGEPRIRSAIPMRAAVAISKYWT